MGVNKKDKKVKLRKEEVGIERKSVNSRWKKKKKKVSGSPFKIQKSSKTITRVTIQYT